MVIADIVYFNNQKGFIKSPGCYFALEFENKRNGNINCNLVYRSSLHGLLDFD